MLFLYSLLGTVGVLLLILFGCWIDEALGIYDGFLTTLLVGTIALTLFGVASFVTFLFTAYTVTQIVSVSGGIFVPIVGVLGFIFREKINLPKISLPNIKFPTFKLTSTPAPRVLASPVKRSIYEVINDA